MTTTDPMKKAWSEVAESVSALGNMMRERYRDSDEAARNEASEASEALRTAVDRLVEAGREVGDRVSDVARDDDVKAHAKQTAGSLDQALNATVELISEQVSGLFGRAGKDRADDGSTPPWDPPPAQPSG